MTVSDPRGIPGGRGRTGRPSRAPESSATYRPAAASCC